MVVKYKMLCSKCKKNYVVVTFKNKFPVCYECQKPELLKEITDPKMKEMFDIPESYYETNAFLRDIKLNYLRYGKLSEKQVEAFKKVVKDLKK